MILPSVVVDSEGRESPRKYYDYYDTTASFVDISNHPTTPPWHFLFFPSSDSGLFPIVSTVCVISLVYCAQIVLLFLTHFPLQLIHWLVSRNILSRPLEIISDNRVAMLRSDRKWVWSPRDQPGVLLHWTLTCGGDSNSGFFIKKLTRIWWFSLCWL